MNIMLLESYFTLISITIFSTSVSKSDVSSMWKSGSYDVWDSELKMNLYSIHPRLILWCVDYSKYIRL